MAVEPERFQVGDRIHVWVGQSWSKGKVVSSFLWHHPSGNDYRAYRVNVGGWMVTCSANSIKEFTEPKRRRKARS